MAAAITYLINKFGYKERAFISKFLINENKSKHNIINQLTNTIR